MPTPRKPTYLKVVQGTAKKNPGRLNPNEPGFNGPIGEPPAHLDEYTAAIWHELVRIACPGVLQKSDRIAVERLACLLALCLLNSVGRDHSRLAVDALRR